MKDKEFLASIHARLYWSHPAYPLTSSDMKRLLAIIDRTPDDQDTRIGGEASIEERISLFRQKYSTGEYGSGRDLIELIEALNKRMDGMANDIATIVKG